MSATMTISFKKLSLRLMVFLSFLIVLSGCRVVDYLEDAPEGYAYAVDTPDGEQGAFVAGAPDEYGLTNVHLIITAQGGGLSTPDERCMPVADSLSCQLGHLPPGALSEPVIVNGLGEQGAACLVRGFVDGSLSRYAVMPCLLLEPP